MEKSHEEKETQRRIICIRSCLTYWRRKIRAARTPAEMRLCEIKFQEFHNALNNILGNTPCEYRYSELRGRRTTTLIPDDLKKLYAYKDEPPNFNVTFD